MNPTKCELPLVGVGEPSTIALALLCHARDEPNRPAYCEVVGRAERWFSWGQIAHWVCATYDSIKSENLPSGAHVASVAANSVEWFVLDFACQILGYTHVAIDHRWPSQMVARLLANSHSKLVFSPQQSYPSVRSCEIAIDREAPPIDPDRLAECFKSAEMRSGSEPAQMLFTSGTTGDPKGVLLSHRNLVSNAFAKLDAAPQRKQDLRLNILPFCHAYARTCELSTWVLSNSRLAIAQDWMSFQEQARLLRPTLINLVPHLASKLLYDPVTKQRLNGKEVASGLGGNVRLLQVGGAPLADDVWHELEKAGLPPLQGYGLTEASPVVCSNRAGLQRPGTIGPPVAGVELRVDSQHQLWVRSEGVMQGYYGDPMSTQVRIQDGWLATGDLAECDSSGNYRIVGRLSDVIVLSTGLKVSPEPIEARLNAESLIERSLLAGEGNPYLVAVVWLASVNDGSMLSENSGPLYELLASIVRERFVDLPEFMHPQKFIVVAGSETDSKFIGPKGNLRRKVALAHFAGPIQRSYSLEKPIFVCDQRSAVDSN